jgi:hypothetical protein
MSSTGFESLDSVFVRSTATGIGICCLKRDEKMVRELMTGGKTPIVYDNIITRGESP